MDRVSRVHRKKPKGKPMSRRASGANAKRSTVRARIEHVFARQKDQMGLFIRTIGIARGSEDHTRQPRLQYPPPDLPRTPGRHGIAASGDDTFRLSQPKSCLKAVTTEQDAVFAPQSAPRRHVDVGAQLLPMIGGAWDGQRVGYLLRRFKDVPILGVILRDRGSAANVREWWLEGEPEAGLAEYLDKVTGGEPM